MTKSQAQDISTRLIDSERCQDSLQIVNELNQQINTDLNLMYDALTLSDSLVYNYRSQYQNEKQVTSMQDDIINQKNTQLKNKDREIVKWKIIAVATTVGGVIVGILIKAIL